MTRRLIGLLALAALVTGCKQNVFKQPCMSMSGQSDLLKSATSLEVTVYKGTVDCASPTGTPLQDKKYSPNDTIDLSIKKGDYTIILQAFANTTLIARACTVTTLKGGSQVCFDLNVVAVNPTDMSMPDAGVDLGMPDLTVPDLSGADFSGDDLTVIDQSIPDDLTDTGDMLPPDDLVTPADFVIPPDFYVPPDMFGQQCQTSNDCKDSTKPYCENFQCVQCRLIGSNPTDCPGATCCNNACKNTGTDTANCGGCGKQCNSAGPATQSSAPSCAGGFCNLHCANGAENCDADFTNGCETNLGNDINNCGECSRVCNGTNVGTKSCSSGKCNSTCNTALFGNCNQPAQPTADDGCEKALNNDASNCSGCNIACGNAGTQVGSKPTCGGSSGGTCIYACAVGKFDCDSGTAPDTNGCECDGNTTGEHIGAMGCCNSGCQTRHDTGNNLGGPTTPYADYWDCVAAPAITEAQATKYCKQWTGGSGCDSGAESVCAGGGSSAPKDTICGTRGGQCFCWQFGGGGAKGTTGWNTGGNAGTCNCPTSADHSSSWN